MLIGVVVIIVVLLYIVCCEVIWGCEFVRIVEGCGYNN